MRGYYRKYLFIVLSCVLFGALNAALPPRFTAAGNPSLYKILQERAEMNLQKLEKSRRRQYQSLLKYRADVVMPYLIAYESDVNLILTNPAAIKSNYDEIVKLLEHGTKFEPEFYLSYIARQTVSDERIEAYRKAFLDDGLREIMQSSVDDIDLYRKVSLWCVARLVFKQTSGRDQTPLDITQKSLYGRCEEMQILFVAAARTVGLASRPASTPWWAHSDNNHAWAEVFLEGEWHYTGDMEAAYFPDQTWFSGMIDKTVLILADGSLASGDDEVLITGKYDTVINSIRNYAKERTRTLKLSIVAAAGEPLPKVSFGVMVYNWGSLRSLIWLETDAEGKFDLSVGRGAFYISAFKDGKKGLMLVPSGVEENIDVSMTLSDKPFADEDLLLIYPSNPMEWSQAPEIWNEGVKLAKAEWNVKHKSFSERVLPFQAEHADSLFVELCAAVRGNYDQFLSFVLNNPPLTRQFMIYLLNEDPKFLWQASAEQFEALHTFFNKFDSEDYGDEELASLMGPNVHWEELPRAAYSHKKKAQLYPKAFVQKGKHDAKHLDKIMRWQAKTYKIEGEKALSGLLSLEIAVKQKYLNALQYRMLSVSIARANGFSTQFTRIPNLIKVLLDGDWRYYNVAKQALEDGAGTRNPQSFELKVSCVDELGFPLNAVDTQFSVNRYQDGAFYPIVYLEQKSKGVFGAQVPQGKYYLQFGYRNGDDKTGFHIRHIDGSALDKIELEIASINFPKTWDAADSEYVALLNDASLPGITHVLIGNHDRENSKRVADKLSDLKLEFLWLGFEETPDAASNYVYSPAWKELVTRNPANAFRTITLVNTDEGWRIYDGLWERLP
ncbi:MAG: transglutaminase domain-containing protein [Candidatus Cloacimonadaceae bacterium]|nr:transglutaminase domain-containing protein [Candidatus Cloacimonadaceae bacterium]